MKKQFKFIGIGAAIACVGVGVALVAPGKAISKKDSQGIKTESAQSSRDRYSLINGKAEETVATDLSEFGTETGTEILAQTQNRTGRTDPRIQMQENVDEKISALSPVKQKRLIENHYPVILRQKPKTGIKKIFKSRNGVILKKEFVDGRIKYFDKKGNYLKQKNRNGSWQFKIGYTTENDWHLTII